MVPLGRFPGAEIEKVYGAMPPVANMLEVSVALVTPWLSEYVPTLAVVRYRSAAMVSENVAVPVTGTPAESVAVTVTGYCPAELAPGIPAITPVLALSVRPAGRTPEVT